MEILRSFEGTYDIVILMEAKNLHDTALGAISNFRKERKIR